MHHETTDWLVGLAAFVAERRSAHPPRAAESPAAAAAERAIVAAGLTSWFDDWAAVTDARRRWARADAAAGRDPDPAFVVTTSAAGIEAMAAVGGGHPIAAAEALRIMVVTELEYRLWCIRRPDEGHRRHLNHWTWVKTRVPPQRAAEFAAHPLGPDEAYWLHRVGTAGAGEADRRDCHLWKWNGRHAALLQASVREGRATHFLAPRRPADGG